MSYKINYKALDSEYDSEVYRNLFIDFKELLRKEHEGVEANINRAPAYPEGYYDYSYNIANRHITLRLDLKNKIAYKVALNYELFTTAELKLLDDYGYEIDTDASRITGQTVEDWWYNRNGL